MLLTNTFKIKKTVQKPSFFLAFLFCFGNSCLYPFLEKRSTGNIQFMYTWSRDKERTLKAGWGHVTGVHKLNIAYVTHYLVAICKDVLLICVALSRRD